ncbi:armadillo repeat-containing protein 10-like isoform X2 [Acropora palmata]|uniref:armadillo repeat-containing protein 10-like isoform X2 n=1 Tax=Acropora palmata TaxID=6131 RepID=UPI003DA032AE
MSGTGRAARIVLYAVCSTFAAATLLFTLYYLRNRKRSRKKERITGPSIRLYDQPSLATFIDGSETSLAELLKENGHGEFSKGTISSLLRCIEVAETSMLEKFLVALLNCSAFTANQNTIRECGGLPLLISLLSHDNKVVNIKAAQVLSNLAMNEENQQTLKDSVFAIIKILEYCDIFNNEEFGIELLRLLVNLSATNIAHEEIMTGVAEYYSILGQSLSRQIQQVLRLLVNLSCNANNLDGLLEFKPFIMLQSFMLPDNSDDIILRAVTISANLLSNSDCYTKEQQLMVTEDLNVLYGELTELLEHSNEDIQSQAKRAFRSVFAFRMMYTAL